MSHPTDDDLVDLVVGDGSQHDGVSTHVDTCDECSATVAQLRRAAGLVASAPANAAWQPPGDAVWGRITDQLTTDDLSDDLNGDAVAHDPAILEPAARHAPQPEPMQSIPSGSTSGHTADELGARRRATSRRRAIGWGAGIAAAGLVIGLVAGRAIWQPETTAQPISQVALSTLDTKQPEGEAAVVRSGEGLDLTVATSQPLDPGEGYLEVWLLNADGKRMVSVGVLGNGDEASFPISQSLIDEGYVIVDISQERFDDAPTHSGDSLLRGKLPA